MNEVCFDNGVGGLKGTPPMYNRMATTNTRTKRRVKMTPRAFYNKKDLENHLKSNPGNTGIFQEVLGKKDKGNRRYLLFKEPFSAIKSDKNLAEYFMEGEARRFYADIDDYVPVGTFKDNQDLLNTIFLDRDRDTYPTDYHENVKFFYNIIDCIKEHLEYEYCEDKKSLFPGVWGGVRVVEKDGKEYQKVSLHVIFYGNLFKNHKHLTTAVNTLKRGVWFRELQSVVGDAFDFSVYGKNQGLRVFNQSKRGEPESILTSLYDTIEVEQELPKDLGFVKRYREPETYFKETEEYKKALVSPNLERPITFTAEETVENLKILDKILDLFPASYFVDYSNYRQVMTVCKRESGGNMDGFSLACKYSRKAPGYESVSEEEHLKNWNGFEETTNNRGSLYNALVKLGLKDKYISIVYGDKEDNDSSFWSVVYSGTDEEWAEYVYRNLGDRIIYSDITGWWSLRENNTWACSGAEPENMRTNTIKTIMPRLDREISKIRSGTEEEQKENEDLLKCLSVASKRVRSSRTYVSLLPFLREKCKKRNLEDLLDSNHDLFAFNDCVIDMRTNVIRPIDPMDWITLTTGYDYCEPKREVVKEVYDIVNAILDKEGDTHITEFVLQELATTLCGRRRISDVQAWTGIGGNGKGVLSKIMENTLGKYSVPAPEGLFTTKTISRSPELLSLRGARCVWVNEPEKDDQITSLLKKLDGDGIRVRDNHAKSREMVTIRPSFALVISYNETPSFSRDGGTRRRLRVVPFTKTYRSNPDPKKGEIKADPIIKEKMETDTDYRDAFLHILREAYMRYRDNGYEIDPPREVLDKSEDCLNESNPVCEWFNEEYEIDIRKYSDKKMTRKDLYEKYKQAMISRGEHKIYSQKNVTSMIIQIGVPCKKIRGIHYYHGFSTKCQVDLTDE